MSLLMLSVCFKVQEESDLDSMYNWHFHKGFMNLQLATEMLLL